MLIGKLKPDFFSSLTSTLSSGMNAVFWLSNEIFSISILMSEKTSLKSGIVNCTEYLFPVIDVEIYFPLNPIARYDLVSSLSGNTQKMSPSFNFPNISGTLRL